MMSPWLFNVLIHAWMVWCERWMLILHGKVLELRLANGGRFEINQLFSPDDTALLANSDRSEVF